MKASIRATPASRQASIMPAASRASIASGFSHSTCLPAAAARRGPLGVEVVRQWDVHGLDVRIGEQVLVAAVAAGDPQLAGPPARHARPTREAIATTAQRAERCIAGMTLRVAIEAHPSTPHLTRSSSLIVDPRPRAIASQASSTSIRIAFSAPSASPARIASITAARKATEPSSARRRTGLAAASSATRTIAPAWASSELWAASTTAHGSRGRRGAGRAVRPPRRRSADAGPRSRRAARSVRRAAARRAAAAAIDARTSYSSRRSSARSMSANCHARRRRRGGARPRRGRTRVPVFGRTSTSPLPAAP